MATRKRTTATRVGRVASDRRKLLRRWLAAALSCVLAMPRLGFATGSPHGSGWREEEDELTPGPAVDEGVGAASTRTEKDVAVVFVTSRGADNLLPCRRGLVEALKRSVDDMPRHR